MALGVSAWTGLVIHPEPIAVAKECNTLIGQGLGDAPHYTDQRAGRGSLNRNQKKREWTLGR